MICRCHGHHPRRQRAGGRRHDVATGARGKATVIPYQALLSVHLVAVAVFLAGLFTSSAVLPGLTRSHPRTAAQDGELARSMGMNRFFTTPALAFVWIFGVAMAVKRGWFASGWLGAKIAIVLLLSGWHGRHMRTSRLLAAGHAVRRSSRRSFAILAIATVVIIVLVIEKRSWSNGDVISKTTSI